MVAWAAEIDRRVAKLSRVVDGPEGAKLSDERRARLRADLATLSRTVRHRHAARFLTWFSGWRRERRAEMFAPGDRAALWARVHDLETEIDTCRENVTVLVAEAREHVERSVTDPTRRQALLEELDGQGVTAEARRAVAAHLKTVAHDAAAEHHEVGRDQYAGLEMLSIGLLGLAASLVVVQWVAPDLRLVPPIDGGDGGPGSPEPVVLLILVMLVGVVGGALSAITNVYLPQSTDTRWFDRKPALAVFKLAAGLWTAWAGVLAVGTGLLDGQYESLPSVLLLALVFGYGQQAVTSFLDRQASSLTAAT